MDFRIAKTNEPYMLEANPNPYLEKTGELAMAAAERRHRLRAARLQDPRVRGRPVPPPRPRGAGEASAGGAVLNARQGGAGRSGLSQTSFRTLIGLARACFPG